MLDLRLVCRRRLRHVPVAIRLRVIILRRSFGTLIEIVSVAIDDQRLRRGWSGGRHRTRPDAVVQSRGGIGVELRTVDFERLAVAAKLFAARDGRGSFTD